MNPMLQEKLLDLLVNILAIIIGGGLITVLIEWRRHKRELATWQREDETLQIDIPIARMFRSLWQIDERTPDKLKLMMYENQLEGTVSRLVVYAEFVIRNTTPAEIVITSYDMERLTIPAGKDLLDFYNLETFDLISPSDMGAITLRPYATIPRVLVFNTSFDKDRKLPVDALPTLITISVTTSSGKVVRRSAELNLSPAQGITEYGKKFVPIKYYQKVAPEEDDIPF